MLCEVGTKGQVRNRYRSSTLVSACRVSQAWTDGEEAGSEEADCDAVGGEGKMGHEEEGLVVRTSHAEGMRLLNQYHDTGQAHDLDPARCMRAARRTDPRSSRPILSGPSSLVDPNHQWRPSRLGLRVPPHPQESSLGVGAVPALYNNRLGLHLGSDVR